MANRRNYYFRQKVTEAELDAGFEGLEQADFNIAIDHELTGITTGLAVSEAAVPDLTVDVSLGTGYSKQGERIRVSGTQNVDCSQDDGGTPTTVATPGNTKVVSVFIEFDRALSDPRIDGNSLTVYFVSAESYSFSVVQGAEAVIGSEVPPALDTGKLLLADIRLVNGGSTITNAGVVGAYDQIDTTRREDAFKFTGGTVEIEEGTAYDAIDALLTALNAEIAASAKIASSNTFTASNTFQADVDMEATLSFTEDSTETLLLQPKMAITPVDPLSVAWERLLLFKCASEYAGGNVGLRLYFSSLGGSAQEALEIAINANWSGSVWNQIDTASDSKIYRFAKGKLTIEKKDSGAGAPWNDNAWDVTEIDTVSYASDRLALRMNDGYLSFRNPTVAASATAGNPSEGTVVEKNALYAKSLPVAWGYIQIDAAGAVLAHEAFGVNALTPGPISSVSTYPITFVNAMDDAKYAVITTPLVGSSQYHYPVSAQSTGGFTIDRIDTTTGLQVTHAGVGGIHAFSFVVFGTVS